MSPAMSENEEGEYQKGVKHLSEKGIIRVPTKYILPASDRPLISDQKVKISNDLIELPVIDFGEVHGPNRRLVLRSLAHACQHYGFFQLTNHGISRDVIDKMGDVSRRFFEQPMTERQKYMTSDLSSPVRYGTSFNQNLDNVFCWRDFLKLSCSHPLSDHLPLWPSSPSDLREVGNNYALKTKALYLEIMEAILESLGIGKNSYMEDLDNGSQLLVLNCYPNCPEPELTLGMPPHSDYGFLTLLLQDEIFSNGRYKSVLHRVLVNSSKLRFSVASLHSLSFKRMVRPAEELIDEQNPKRYKDTDFASFMEYISSLDHKDKHFIESRKIQ
ncbi:hypothetical protein V2J09_019575 [Rumex salicifolius]